jgi:PRTRC genetic system protein C
MARIFVYEGKEYPDPDSNMKPEEVRQSMANFFPELSNAEAKESKRGDDTVFTMTKRVGTKG